ncbi:MAG TPA: ABC transporter permease subunit, partial [Bacilli bacterium]|nr:ABC transporter permease subunit [Bacilli bacterium]
VVLLQMGAILIDRATGHPTVIVVQFGDDVPFLVPLLAISVLPATLIYGTLRLAVEREWTEGYIKTAASKGLARMPIFFTHILRNTMEDLLTILPRGVTVAVTSMAVAEVMCFIFGLGGYAISPSVVHVTTLTTTCGILAVITMLLHLVLALVRKRFVVNTSEGGA